LKEPIERQSYVGKAERLANEWRSGEGFLKMGRIKSQ
jgi:hypothetical protein